MFRSLSNWISAKILRYLQKPTGRYAPFFAPDIEVLREILQPGDVLLVEGNTRLSAIIKHLTQSSWSHATLFIGDALSAAGADTEGNVLIEAEAGPGVCAVPLSKYAGFNTRICRPVGLGDVDRKKVIDYVLQRIGMQYDSKQVVDLARYLFPYPPVPVAFRRRMLTIGSGDPTRAICSTLIGEAFSSVRFPILPETSVAGKEPQLIAPYVEKENAHIRTHGLFTPRDFDISPYFEVIKPGLKSDFDFRNAKWLSKAIS